MQNRYEVEEMKESIKDHVAQLFASAPKTRRSWELQDEICANLCERYDDLIAEGEEPSAAYQKVINGIGDADELIATLNERDVLNPRWEQSQRQKSAILVSVAVMLYILSLVPVIIMQNAYSTVIMFIITAAATGLLVYNGASKPKYEKADQTMVEEFKQWTQDKGKSRSITGAIHSTIWSVAVMLYLILGLALNLWHPGWIIFPLTAVVGQLINMIRIYREGDDR